MGRLSSHKELIVYQRAFDAAMEIYILTKSFPKEETYSLVDQIRRSSRSVAANLAEAFRRRHYPRMFVAKLIDCESEAAETQAWIDFSSECQYITKPTTEKLNHSYEEILRMITEMKLHPDRWAPFPV